MRWRAPAASPAARNLLHISQPTVTTQVRFLEETYGIELFYRRGHKVKLTPLGEQLYAMAQQIFALESETVHLLNDSGELKSGHLRVGAVGPFHVTEMLAASTSATPACRCQCASAIPKPCWTTWSNYQTDVAVLAQFTDDPRFHSCRTAGIRS